MRPSLFTSVRPLVAGLLSVFVASSLAAEPRDISANLEPVRVQYHLPACASAVVEDGRIIAIGATGVRCCNRDVRVTVDDVWHIGSCTKSMTAALVGVMVDQEKLRWDTCVADAFAGLPCHPAWRKVTVWDLVTQRSGIGAVSRNQFRTWSTHAGSAREQRVAFARALLAQPPAEPPGHFAYSNAGYGLLGALLEHVTGETYEDLLQKHLFTPLDLKSAGFGAPATPGKIDQPWGHRRTDDHVTFVDPASPNPFPLVLAPAGCVHLSIADFARYAAWVSSGEPHLMKPGTFAHLQTPPEGSSYAGGVWKTELPGAGGEAVCHTGHLGGFFAVFYAGSHRACVSVFNTEGGGWEWLGDIVAAEALKAAP